MPIFENAFALQIPVQIEKLHFTFYINQNLYTVSSEVSSSPHNHHDYELRFVASGTCTQFIDGKRYTVRSQSCLITHPFEYHWRSWSPEVGDSTQYNLRFSLKEPPDNNPKAKECYQRFIAFMDGLRCFAVDSPHFSELFQYLTEEIYQRKDGFPTAVKSLCTQIIVEMIRCSSNDAHFFLFEECKYYNYEQNKIDLFLDKKLLEDISVKDLADEMYVSVRQLNYIMHRLYRMSFVEKLTEMRLQLAATQLLYSDSRIRDIAAACGFQSQNYFFKCFRKAYSVTPLQYRKQERKKLPPSEP